MNNDPKSAVPADREESVTQKMRGRPVTHEEAAESAQRLVNSHFNNPDRARMQIPVRASDDDVIVCDFIAEHPDTCSSPSPIPASQSANVTVSYEALQHLVIPASQKGDKRNTDTQSFDGSNLEDSHLEALLRYSAGFYGAAVDHGMKAKDTVHAMQHIEQAARGLHKVCTALRTKQAHGNGEKLS